MELDHAIRSVPLAQFVTPHPQQPWTMAAAWLTGFLVEADGRRIVVSAGHFSAQSRTFRAQFFDPPATLPMSLVYREFNDRRRTDVAVFDVDEQSLTSRYPALSIALDDAVSLGDDVYMLGYPYPDLLTKHYGLARPMLVAKKGIVGARVAANDDRAPFIVLDVIWDTGMSGGPVIHAASGKVVGVVSSRPLIDGKPIEIVASPSGTQILDVIASLKFS